MRSVIIALLVTLRASLRTRVALQLEILALRHQLQVLERTCPRRVRLTRANRLLWSWLYASGAGGDRPSSSSDPSPSSPGIGEGSGCCGRGRVDTVRADQQFLLQSTP